MPDLRKHHLSEEHMDHALSIVHDLNYTLRHGFKKHQEQAMRFQSCMISEIRICKRLVVSDHA